MNKKKWKKPKLVTLVRGKPEEGLLTECKFPMDYGGAGNQGANNSCDASDGSSHCAPCLSREQSS